MTIGRRWLIGALVLVMGVAGWGYRNARADPLVRRAAFALPHWPAGARPVTVALLSDVHIGNAVTDSTRLARIAAQVEALRPDLILIAGDFVAGHEPGSAATHATALAAGLRALRAPLGVYAVLGNHDHWTGPGAVRAALARIGIHVLANEAVAAGPLALGGIDDDYSGHADPARTARTMAALPGAPVAISHSPDVRVRLDGKVPLLLAGHTHCGQIMIPWLFAPRVPSRFGQRYRCGIIREGRTATVVTAGTGTSIVPFRFGAPPDIWLLRLGP